MDPCECNIVCGGIRYLTFFKFVYGCCLEWNRNEGLYSYSHFSIDKLSLFFLVAPCMLIVLSPLSVQLMHTIIIKLLNS